MGTRGPHEHMFAWSERDVTPAGTPRPNPAVSWGRQPGGPMLNALKICCCPHCAARFALEMDEGRPEPVPAGCPCCGLCRAEVVLLAPEEGEAWELWRQLALHLECLPPELRASRGDWNLSPEARPCEPGLLRADCAECESSAWLPLGASRCPVCRASLGLRQAG
jgi:hypothetical protein